MDDIICMNEVDLEATYAQRNPDRAPDAIFVCAPSITAQETACRMLAGRGKVNFFAGLPKGSPMTAINANTFITRNT